MGWLIIGSIAFLVLFYFGGLYEKPSVDSYYRKFGWKFSTKQWASLLALLLMVPSFMAWVPANNVGIVYSPIGGTRTTTMDEGVHAKNPLDKIYKISTELQTAKIEDLTTQTKDAQFVTTDLEVKYKVNEENAYMVFKQFRTLKNVQESLISSASQRIFERITRKYNVIDCLGEYGVAIYDEFELELAAELATYGIDFDSVTIVDMDAGEAIEAAITAEAVAKKEVETAQQKLAKAETEAKQKSVLAQAEQDAAKIEADTKIIQAEAEKKANDLLLQSITDEIIMKLWIEKRNGEVPEYYGGDGADLIFNTGTLEEE